MPNNKEARQYFNVIYAFVLAMETKDPYIKGHAERVTQYAVEIAKRLGLSGKEIRTIYYAGLVHDIGKIGTPDSILNKPGKLSEQERLIIELHPVKGAELLENIKFFDEGILGVRYHHERFDGKGYPEGLKKGGIPVIARILACADAFDAMTSDRPYRFRKLTIDEAAQEIKKCSGSQFDPKIAKIFLGLLDLQQVIAPLVF